MTKLVIVESPAKCSKIQSFLGADWTVLASFGHIRALDASLDAVGIDDGWTPRYVELAPKKEQIAKLKKAAKAATEVWLATDDDREGEAIAWHICHILKLPVTTTPRIVFHEITRTAIEAAVAAPRRLDMNRVNAQQARAMLDMLVGFTISRVLWKRVAPRLSAGRCQTPALRLVVERDQEIAGHVARNFWHIRGTLSDPQHPLPISTSGEYTEADVQVLLSAASKGRKDVDIVSVKERMATSAPPAPLITSTLQQEASALHGLGPKATMSAAQKLYELGHITYMRTDNPQLSVEAVDAIRAQIREVHGEAYVGPVGAHCVAVGTPAGEAGSALKPKGSKDAKKPKKDNEQGVQGGAPPLAHEAIRPTHPEVTHMSGDMDHSHQVVYRLIWKRAVQSQMAAATTQVRTAVLNVAADPVAGRTWTAEQSKPVFDGWRILDRTTKTEEAAKAAEAAWATWTPKWSAGSTATWSSLGADEVYTKPAGRYTEATLIRELEKRGIGRPSTFASLVTTLFDREYVEKTHKEGREYATRHLTLTAGHTKPVETKETHKTGAEKNKISATPLGVSVTECLQAGFADLFEYTYTAQMESGLDAISQGDKAWKTILQETWDTYKDRYAVAMTEAAEVRQQALGVEGGAMEGVKVVQTKKGPLLVRNTGADGKAEFAPLPTGVTAANAATALSEEAVAAAFASAKEAREGEMLGTWTSSEGTEYDMRKKKGPYGFYVQASDLKVPWKPEDTVETLKAKLDAKAGAFERTVGPYIIKQGPYGYYFYAAAKAPAGKKGGKPTFVGVPKDKDPATISEAELAAAAKEAPAKKKAFAAAKKGGVVKS